MSIKNLPQFKNLQEDARQWRRFKEQLAAGAVSVTLNSTDGSQTPAVDIQEVEQHIQSGTILAARVTIDVTYRLNTATREEVLSLLAGLPAAIHANYGLAGSLDAKVESWGSSVTETQQNPGQRPGASIPAQSPNSLV